MAFEVKIESGLVVKRLMTDIQFDEYRRLVSLLADGDTIMEIGVYQGGSLSCLAPTIQEKDLSVIAVDVFDAANYDEPNVMCDVRGMRGKFDANMQAVGLFPLVLDISNNANPIELLHGKNLIGNIDFIFIDGDHSYEATLKAGFLSSSKG